MKKAINILIITVCVALPWSCDEGFLNTQPLDKVSSEAVWSDGSLSQAFVYNVYSFLGYGGFEEQALASITDEAMFTHAGRNIDRFTEGTESPGSLAWISGTYEWGNMYLAIREANVAIANLPEATFDETLRDRLLGEALFLRAYYYHQLLRYYGGVPLILEPYGLDEDYTIARNTFAECVDAIVADLDQATTLLTGKEVTAGRASRLSAMALKARVLAYAASDLHDATTAQANSTILAGYSNIELVAYTSGNQTDRWTAAQAAAKAVLDATSGYKMNLTAPVTPEEGEANYVSIAMGGQSAVGDATAAIELIFQRTHTPLYTQESAWPLGGIHYGINNGPNGYHNWAGNTPIQQLVDDYEMMDGSEFDWGNPAHAATPYDNRDPRFYATILYDGADWKPRPDDVVSYDSVDQIQTGFYEGRDPVSGEPITINGVDTRKSSVEDWNGTRTHYYTRKFIDPDPALPDNQSNAQVIPWPFIRYTEMAFLYAEASIELGQEQEARDWINKIRFRAGMPGINDSGAALMDRLRNERRIELAYEEHRYHDGRRWMIGSELGRGIKSIQVTADLKPGMLPTTRYAYDPTRYDYTYTVVDNVENETRVWNDKMYYRPISRDEINRNDMLIQNPGY